MPGNSPSGAVTVILRSSLPALATPGLAKHDRADFAQEFLRRNDAYRAAWETRSAAQGDDGQARGWGLAQWVDPDRSVRSAPAIWHEDRCSHVVTLVPAPCLNGAAAFPHGTIMGDFRTERARRLVVDRNGVRHRFNVIGGNLDKPLAILLPPLGDPLRVAACDAARRMVAGLSVAEPVAMLRPSPLQHQRLALLLRVLDAARAGASNREIGTAIVYPWLGTTDSLVWKASGERRRVQRLLAEARQLATVGYRALLRA